MDAAFLNFCRRFQLDPQMMKQAAEELAPKSGAPNYKLAASAEQSCGTCRNYDRGRCTMYDFDAVPNYVCDSWQG